MKSTPCSSRWIMLSTFDLPASFAISQRSAQNQSKEHTDHSHLGTLNSKFQSYADKYLTYLVIVDHVYIYMLHARLQYACESDGYCEIGEYVALDK